MCHPALLHPSSDLFTLKTSKFPVNSLFNRELPSPRAVRSRLPPPPKSLAIAETLRAYFGAAAPIAIAMELPPGLVSGVALIFQLPVIQIFPTDRFGRR